jgi:hypothetical protein
VLPGGSLAYFKLDASETTKADSPRTGGREIEYSTAHEWAPVIYRHADRPPVARVRNEHLRSKGKRSMRGSQGSRI